MIYDETMSSGVCLSGMATDDLYHPSLATLATDLRTFLLAQAGITTLVGTRIYPSWIPQSQTTRPNITIDHYGSNHDYELGKAANWCSAQVQIDCWSSRLSEAKAVAEAIRTALQAYSGAWCEVALLRRQFDLYEAPKQADDEPIYHVAQQWEIIIRET